MSYRTEILTNFASTLAAHSIGYSDELPWDQSGQPLYQKNMKRVYLDSEQTDRTELFNCLDNQDVIQATTTLTGYLNIDAKTLPSDIDTVISNILLSGKTVSNASTKNSSVTTEFQGDTITYTFNFEYITI